MSSPSAFAELKEHSLTLRCRKFNHNFFRPASQSGYRSVQLTILSPLSGGELDKILRDAMDPLSLSCAALQLLGSAVAAVKVSLLLYKKFTQFRQFFDEINRILENVDCQRTLYRIQLNLLLVHAGQHEDVIEMMLENTAHPQWTSKELGAGLKMFLGKSLRTGLRLIEQIEAVLSRIHAEIRCFDTLAESRHEEQSMKDAFRRLYEKTMFTCNISRIDSQVKEFKDLRDELRHLIRDVVKIKVYKRSLPPHTIAPRLAPECGSIAIIKRASKDLHKVLAKAWLDSMGPEPFELSKHNVKLLLDAQAEQEVQLGVVITCHGQCLKEQLPPRSVAVKLHVKSCPIDFIETATQTQSDGNDNDRRKRLRVRFSDIVADSMCTAEAKTTKSFAQESALPPDLGQTGNICTAFHAKSTQHDCKPHCLGYLDSPDDDAKSSRHRHKFFQVPAGPSRLEFRPAFLCASMQQLLIQPVHGSLTVVDQLKLARSLVMAVLKFHSTPWLQDYFSLQDVSFFRSDAGTIAECLETAHLTVNLVQQPPDTDSAIAMSDSSNSDEEAVETAKLTHGVHNLTLWSLGAVLLQIGSWSVIDSPDDVVQVRRLAQNNGKLGKKYKKLTEQCLECNFAFGYDLAKPRLQQAVYENVVGGLSDIIKSLDIGDESD